MKKSLYLPAAGIGLLIVLLLAAWYGYGASYWREWVRANALAEAQQRWTQHAPDRYRLVLEHANRFSSTPATPCTQDIAVHHGEVVQVFQNTCGWDPQTIDDFFEAIEQDEPWINWHSLLRSSLMLECVDIVEAQITYHPKLGYPQNITSRYSTAPDWLSPTLWSYIRHNYTIPHSCQWRDMGERRMTIHMLTALP
jgi:hypothetical protein